MTDSFVTQCPHCQKSFRVSHNQLSVARGAVRCGACMQVFNAARQLLEQNAARQPAQQETTIIAPVVAAPRPPLSQREWQAEADLDALDLDHELARLEKRPDAWTPATDDLAQPPSFSAQRELADDEWANIPFGIIEEPESPAPRPENEEAPRELEHGRPTSKAEPRLTAAADVFEDEDDDEPSLDSARSKHGRNEPALHDDHLLELDDDPLQLQWEKSRSSWSKRLLWGGLALVAALALVAQYAVYHFEELARQDQYRPWFQTLCPALGCKVPAKVDIAQIKSSNLVVRSHPEFNGALVVDAIIYNRAPFSQPFPLLELRFADLNGQLIASRRFKPSEYLSGDLAGRSEMPPQTPIHIALDILDPGTRAVNYSLSFRSPE